MAVRLGLSREEFYKLNPKTFMRYLPYYEEMAKNRKENIDLTAWINGLYVTRSVGTIGKKAYPQRPLNLFGLDSFQDDDESGMSESQKAAEGFAGWAYAFNLQRHKKLGIKEESEVSKDA